MFDLGIQELIVIFIVALLVFGPKRLPELGYSLGKALNEVKKAFQSAKTEMEKEIEEVKETVEEAKKDIKDPLQLKDELFKDMPNLSDLRIDKHIENIAKREIEKKE
ncbi:MAG: Sec-independent protein translocase protein TatB [Thermodesulfovibrio sp.]|uniref:Sec-independent protein translocase protein TatB n=1 Tax=unclassified Thermodesulfovibrio TaxID=2645936 RepID=UPI000839D9B4|nr:MULTISPECIES: Sec-independent protein translocase protein TatB [unclassified Thermodesulfovibrio]MDI1471588.1 Sec-independent protein translocase protein TatB [Thermodesulfovibrio sp. 1176]MDI6715123.1 Sec-independent protein translocase protein TatB [Thermodesulfovibrio sp.]ODA44703.1 Twin-arginine translocation protein TatB [Thermodesulfovibrio sp. N1]